MTSHHSLIACKAIPHQPVTVVAVSYGLDNQLQNEVISGNNKHHSPNPDLPDEGVYLIYKNRALQIAAPPCDQRKCNTSHLCRCNTPVFSNTRNLGRQQNTKKRATTWSMWKPCCGCLFNWLRLYQATEAANKLNFQCLQHPRTLTLANLDEHQTFSYDSELEEEPFRSNRNGNSPMSINSKSCCSARRFEWMCDAWNDFIKCGCCKPRSVTALSDYEDEEHSECCSSAGQDNSGSDSDWDDLDIPCETASASSQSDYDDYDLIEDLIDQEFPKLRKTELFSIRATRPPKVEPTFLVMDDSSFDEEDTPAPVIIPPKNMTVGKGLRSSTNLTPSMTMLSESERITLIAGAQWLEAQSTLSKKRSYRSLIRSGQYNSQQAEDLSRAKQRKLDLVAPQPTDQSRENSTMCESSLRFGSAPQKFVSA
ncbi:hypothetical protein F4776DRAFT_273225 [Hypoxylon sp. NC0597]|nr:hypothetical protein F4776DRAFT_273225 [Hypoxylon sp. NC0597]